MLHLLMEAFPYMVGYFQSGGYMVPQRAMGEYARLRAGLS